MPTGTKSEPKTSAGMRYSGLPFPPFFAVSGKSDKAMVRSIGRSGRERATHIGIDAICKVGPKDGSGHETDTEADVSQASDTDAKAVDAGEDVYGTRQWRTK